MSIFYLQSEQVIFHGLQVAPPYFYRSPEWTKTGFREEAQSPEWILAMYMPANHRQVKTLDFLLSFCRFMAISGEGEGYSIGCNLQPHH